MIHLHTRSRYSLLEAVLDIDDIIRLAKENHQTAVALTDHRSMFATMSFVHAAKEAGLKPIIGLEVETNWKNQPISFLLLAKNGQGLHSLYLLSTRLMSDSTPLELDDMKAYVDGCILMNAGGDDVFETLAHEPNEDLLDELLDTLKSFVLDPDDLYIAMSIHDSPYFRQKDEQLKKRAQFKEIPTVALSRIEYEKPEDERTLRLLQAINQQKVIDHPDIRVRSGRYWRTEDEMESLYDADDLKATETIAARIEDYRLPKASLPQFVNKVNLSSEDYLRELCLAGLKKRLQGKTVNAQVYRERLDHELNVILSMGFADYFLIVWDFIREARSRKILVGPGRGSAAGSLVSWVLGISHVDPIQSGLLFERFLNPDRISMPDIDTDFPDNRRDEVIEYVQSVYGKGHVAHIVTFSRLKARAALRDCAKALGLGVREADKLTAIAATMPNETLPSVYAQSRAFSSLVENSPSLKKLYHAACAIEGFPRHTSIHAGGIVLARDVITEQAPMMDDGSSVPAVQFSMEHLEEIGLIKFDFLALRNLSMIEEILQEIQRQNGPVIEPLHLPLNDPQVYALLRTGDTLGVFQLESSGIRQLILRFKPERFEDIAAILALYRPGPMKSIDTYLNARFNPRARQSIHPLIDPILAETGGIFLYQEQIMEAARILGGFTLAQADILRKAMSKKKRETMEAWKSRFVEGAQKQGIEAEQADKIFEIMEQFADYGFNKSHSYAYGLIVYQMAWLKTHYPLSFYQVLLDYTGKSGAKLASILGEAAHRHIRVLPVSLNRSGTRYQIEGNALRIPLTQVRTFSRQQAEKIEQERQEHGPFTDPVMSVLRLSALKTKDEQIVSLVRAGAFDEMGINRESLEAALEEILRLGDLAMLDPEGGGWRLAGVSAPIVARLPVDPARRIVHEKDVLGFLSGPHPAEGVRASDRSLVSIAAAGRLKGGTSLRICAMISRIHLHKTKKGDTMAYVTLDDDTGQMEGAVMPTTYARAQDDLKDGAFVVAQGRMDQRREGSMAIFELHFLPLSSGPVRRR